MNERIRRLRERSLAAKPSISLERAVLLTEFYQHKEINRYSVPVARALAFKYIMTKKTICINEEELFVGERGPAPKATPTYPEICTHTLKDFQILNTRKNISFSVSEESSEIQRDTIIPFWLNKSIRTRIFQEVDNSWKNAFHAGVFTEFMEQRAPGHAVLDNKIYSKGFNDLKREIQNNIRNLDFYHDTEAFDKREQLKAMAIVADALILYARRYSELAAELAEKENNPQRKIELYAIKDICARVPAYAPQTFYEALQYYWFVHLGIITELNTWDSFCPGRLDQHLYPFYKRDIESGALTREKAHELLQAFWVKFNNHLAPPKVGITAQESATYTDFCLINIGGVTANGEDAVNKLSYLILDVVEEMRLLQPGCMVQISKKSPDRFLQRALKIIKTGYGQPSVFNTDAIVQELVRQGRSVIDARDGGASGCVEISAFGKESCILTGYLNLVKIMEITLSNGIDPVTGKKLGIKTGDPLTFTTFEEFFEAFRAQLSYFIDVKIKGNIIIERLYANYLPAPFMSLLINDCISKGKDYNNGGARYNSSYIQGVGIGSITDSMAAIRYHVFDKKNISMGELLAALKSNYEGHSALRQTLLNRTPKYGNDNEYADEIARQVFEAFFRAVEGRPNTKGGHFRINLLPTTSHIYFGSVVGATPDGRQAGEPLSEGISPVQGADRNGPTAVLKSAAKIDHIRTGGTLLNQKFTPQVLETDDDLTKLGHLIRAYFKMDGHHIQFNVVTGETLREAQKHPEKYRDLIVRVAGYSDYFVDLEEDLQNEIIKRTEQALN